MDSSNAGLWLALILLFVLGNGYFSLIEAALSEGHRGILERMAEDGDRDARAALEILENRKDFLPVAQIGITLMAILTGLSTGFFVSPFFARVFDFLPHAGSIALVFSIGMATCGLLLLGEILPKMVAGQAPERALMDYHRSLRLLMQVARPLVAVLSFVARGTLILLGRTPQTEDTVTEDEVKDLIEQGTEDGTIEKAEQYMVDRVFRLGDQTAYALMTPRTQMLWLDLADPLKHNLRMIRKHPQTVFAVGRESLDDFCGVLYAKDLLDALLEHRPPDIAQHIRKPMFVPRSMEAFRLLEKFRDAGACEAVVLDEYGGVVGFITLGDLLREILGGPAAPGGAEPLQITPRDARSWYVDGLCSIDDFKQRFDIDILPGEEKNHFQTMGGFLTAYFGYIPKPGESRAWNGLRFEVASMDRARIERMLVTQKENGEP